MKKDKRNKRNKRNKRKNRAPIADLWELRLDVKYESEIEYYRKLCGYYYNIEWLRDGQKYDTKSKYLTYEEWEKKIIDGISKLNVNELETYCRFLNQKCRENNMYITLQHSILMPFITAFLSIIIEKIINSYFGFDSFWVSVIIILITFWSFAATIFSDLVRNVKDEEISRYFYQDVKTVVEKYKNKEADD